jgi:hypothetical protein
MTKQFTLGDISKDGKPECFHCEAILPNGSRCEVQGDYLIVYCPACKCMTPFALAKK